jgi:hypothetical protein
MRKARNQEKIRPSFRVFRAFRGLKTLRTLRPLREFFFILSKPFEVSFLIS